MARHFEAYMKKVLVSTLRPATLGGGLPSARPDCIEHRPRRMLCGATHHASRRKRVSYGGGTGAVAQPPMVRLLIIIASLCCDPRHSPLTVRHSWLS
jgi:hypothetical protein